MDLNIYIWIYIQIKEIKMDFYIWITKISVKALFYHAGLEEAYS